MTKMRVKNSTVYSKPRALTKFKVQCKIEVSKICHLIITMILCSSKALEEDEVDELNVS